MMKNKGRKRPVFGGDRLTKNSQVHSNKFSTYRQASLSNNNSIDFPSLNYRLKPHLRALCQRLLSTNGRKEGNEWSCLNPTRSDRKLGSFKVNLVTGQWADFATGDKGGDFISLWAYVRGLNQIKAARELLNIIGGRHG